MLYRLIYASEPTAPMDHASVEAILECARRKNELKDITGMLAFDSRWFLQVLEGDRAHLSALYANLVRDPRHHRLTLIEHVSVRERLFPNWSMGWAAVDPQARQVYLRHSSAGRLEPDVLDAEAALQVLRGLSQLKR